MTRGIPVLMYHALCAKEMPFNGKKSVAINAGAFRTHMNWLYSNGYKTLDARQTERYLTDGYLPDDKCCILTFDDGYYSWHRYARKILSDFGFSATLFLSTAYVNELYDIPDFTLDDEDRPLTWQEIRELSESGWSIQAHGHYHHKWTTLSMDELRDDILLCKNLIEKNVGTPVNCAAYPYGTYSTSILHLLKEIGLKVAYTVHDGLLLPSADLFRLPRIEINSHDTLTSFENKVCTGYASGTRAITSKLRDLVYANSRIKDFLKGAAF